MRSRKSPASDAPNCVIARTKAPPARRCWEKRDCKIRSADMSDREYTIGIDCRFAGTRSGIGRYTEELVRCLLKRNDPWKYILFGWPVGALHATPLQEAHMSPEIIPLPYRHYSIAEQIRFPRLLKKHHIDLLHVPHFNVPLLCPTPFVVTIHDLILHH